MKTALKYTLSLGLTAAFLYWAFAGTDLGAVWQSMAAMSLWSVAAIVLITLTTMVLRAWRWQILMRPFAPQVDLAGASSAVCICYAANCAVPRSGEALRALSIKWRYGTPLPSLVTTVVVERVLDLFTLILVVGATFGLLQARLSQAFPWLGNAAVWGLVGCLVFSGVLLALFLFQERAAALLLRLLQPLSPRLAQRAADLLHTFLAGLKALGSPTAYGAIILSSLLLNAGYALMIYAAFEAFDMVDQFGLGLDATLAIYAVSSLGMVIPTPAGTGTYHKFFADGLTLLFAVPAVQALACATALHAIGNLTYVVLGGVAFLLQRQKRAAAPS